MPVTLGLRPHTTYQAQGDAASLNRHIREAAADYPVSNTGNYLVISIPEDRRHYWSPQLQVTLADDDTTVRVSGLITPMPAVWTLFASAYSLTLVLGFFGTIFGLAQRTLGESSPALWSAPAAIFLLGAIYGAAIIGQRIGHTQTDELVNLLRSCLEQDADSDA